MLGLKTLHLRSSEPLLYSYCKLWYQFPCFLQTLNVFWFDIRTATAVHNLQCDRCSVTISGVVGDYKVERDVQTFRQTGGISHSLSLLIVSRYTTVVVLVVEVVVVLEVVSASSQQRPVSQPVSPVAVDHYFFSSFFFFDRLNDWLSLLYSSVMSRWGSICFAYEVAWYKKTKRRKCTRRKISYIHLHTKKKIHIHTTRPSGCDYRINKEMSG